MSSTRRPSAFQSAGGSHLVPSSATLPAPDPSEVPLFREQADLLLSRTKAQVKDKLREVVDDLEAGVAAGVS